MPDILKSQWRKARKRHVCSFCNQYIEPGERYSSLANAFEIRHAKSEDGWLCYIVEPIKLDAVSLADAAEGWNRRRP